ncbi:MAG: carboxymuconolactone decarboxylase family protein [Pseudomonadota bacterium]
MKHVLKPLEPPYPPIVAKLFQGYPQGKDGHIIQLFRIFANSLRFLAGKGAVNLLDKDSPLTLRERELVILRTTANRGCEYEWGVHVSVFASAAELNSEQIAATAHKGRVASAPPVGWTARDVVLLNCIDDLCHTASISAANYAEFQTHWDLSQQLEIIALCGNYHTISFVANATRLPAEPGAPGFPQTAQRSV